MPPRGFSRPAGKSPPGFWLAIRCGQILTTDAAGDLVWQPDLWRAEIGTIWRISQNLLLKAGCSHTHADGGGGSGNHLIEAGSG